MNSINNKPIHFRTMKIDYLEGVFDAEALNEIKKSLQKENILLDEQPHHPQHIAGIEDMFAQVTIVLSPDLIQAFCLNLISSGMYDTIKTTLCYIHQKLRLAKIIKIKNEKLTENVTPVAHFTIGQNHAVLPLDIDDEKFEYFVDKFFETINEILLLKSNMLITIKRIGVFLHTLKSKSLKRLTLSGLRAKKKLRKFLVVEI